MRERRNILVTTMSTFNHKKEYEMNYYYGKNQQGRKVYCNGISAQEPGSKYFLSKYPIDEIVVIGSQQTSEYEGEVSNLATENLLEEWAVENEAYRKHEISAFDLYKYRMKAFLNDTKQEFHEYTDGVDFFNKIDNIRRKEVENILYKFMEEQRESGSIEADIKINNLLCSVGDKFWKKLKKKIEDDINLDFENMDTHEKYIIEKNIVKEYESQFQENEMIAQKYKKLREEISKDKSLTIFEREYLLIALKRKLIENKSFIEIQKQELENKELENEILRLENEIESLKEGRKKYEFIYARYFAFLSLDEKYCMKPHEKNKERISMIFIPEQNEKVDNIKGIVDALYGDGTEEIDLYIDVQGGNRTSGYVRNAVLSILNNQETDRVHIKEIIGTNFTPGKLEPNEIADETKRHKITDLVSGMNAFIRYGKADMLENYCQDLGISDDSSVGKLVQHMVEIDGAISLCNMTGLVERIQELSKFFKEAQAEGNSEVENIFEILKDGIKRDYGKLLSEEIDYLELISWCNRKGFVQQALTLIEDKMPKVYFDKGILGYEFVEGEEDKQTFIVKVEPSYEKRIENLIFNSLKKKKEIDYSFEVLWQLEDKKKRSDFFSRGMAEKEFLENSQDYIKNKMGKKWFGKKINKETLEFLVEELRKSKTEESFIKYYCKFRRLEDEFEKKGKYEGFNEENIYEEIASKIKQPDELYFSIINCFGENKYILNKEKINKGKQPGKEIKLGKEIKPEEVWIKLYTLPHLENYKNKMEQLFQLHDALKKERNCSNHASEKGIRLPYKVVSKAIGIYVDIAKDIVKKCEN